MYNQGLRSLLSSAGEYDSFDAVDNGIIYNESAQKKVAEV